MFGSSKDKYYKILNIPINASKEEIKTAYLKGVREYHPDRNKSPEAVKKFKDIKTAYEVLMGKSTNDFDAQKQQGGWQQAHGTWSTDEIDLESIFEHINAQHSYSQWGENKGWSWVHRQGRQEQPRTMDLKVVVSSGLYYYIHTYANKANANMSDVFSKANNLHINRPNNVSNDDINGTNADGPKFQDFKELYTRMGSGKGQNKEIGPYKLLFETRDIKSISINTINFLFPKEIYKIIQEMETNNSFGTYPVVGKNNQEETKHINLNDEIIRENIITNKCFISGGGHYNQNEQKYMDVNLNFELEKYQSWIKIKDHDVYLEIEIDYKSLYTGGEFKLLNFRGGFYTLNIPFNNNINPVYVGQYGIKYGKDKYGALYIRPRPFLIEETHDNISIISKLQR